MVFPTGADDRGNGTIDVYYGMADKYIGAARVWLPGTLEYETRDMMEIERLNRLRSVSTPALEN